VRGVRIAPLLCLPLAFACSSNEPEDLNPADGGFVDSGTADSGVTDGGPTDSGAPPCAITGLTAEVRLSEGGRGEIAWAPDGDVTATTLTATAGFVVTLGANGRSASILAPYDTEGNFEIGIHQTCGNVSTDATVPIVLRRLAFSAIAAWNPGVTGPDEREHPMMFIDGANPDRLLLYGGYSFHPRQYTMVTDFWAFDLVGEVWSPITTIDSPQRAGGRLVAFPDRAEAMFAGGADANDTAQLAFDRVAITGTVANWSSVNLAIQHQSAKETQLGALIYDAPRDRYLSVCGVTDFEVHCQIGELASDGRYSVIDPAPGEQPTPRYGFFAAHDEANQRLVIFSGAQTPIRGNPVNPAGDTWALHLDEAPPRWEKILDADPRVPGRRNGCSAFDPIGKRLFVWGGTPDARDTTPGLFALDLGSPAASIVEVQITTLRPVRSSCSATYDPSRHRILFGFGNDDDIYADLVALDL
jgi:hypothetical protein